jgi:phosphohistidine swiveling domain-containing protein
MRLVIPLHEVRDEDRDQVGGKAFSLSRLARMSLNVPDALCIPAEVYNHYVASTGLKERILLELNRKNFQEMRWEEIWDASLRIRNMFLNTPVPDDLTHAIQSRVGESFEGKAVVVRSSAPGEDSAKASFAGLHESYVNIQGAEAILEHVRLVWASLWSDGALLYRKELELDVEKSAMAVVVQEIVVGERSGVVFGKNPNDASQSVIEAVYGLNAGLVDGTVEPDRWILERQTGKILSFTPVSRGEWVRPSNEGTRLEPLPPEFLKIPPLTNPEAVRILHLVLEAEEAFGAPQDMEWTFRGDELYVLQSRPITTVSPEAASTETDGDKRPWYLTLRRSYENLQALRTKIEEELIPAMVKEADRLALQDLSILSDSLLAEEIRRRIHLQEHWVSVYRSDFIPFAHGMRLFGQFYNNTMRPSNPYEFMDLLGGRQLASLERNRLLEEMASMVQNDPSLAERLRAHQTVDDEPFNQVLDSFTKKFGDISCATQEEAGCVAGSDAIQRLLLEMAQHPSKKKRLNAQDVDEMTRDFLSRFEGEQQKSASDLLDLARTSYRLRDDDNIYLGRIEKEMLRAVEEGRRRFERRDPNSQEVMGQAELMEAIKDRNDLPKLRSSVEIGNSLFEMKARQMVGQPAGPGIASGRARVIENPSDLFDFKSGEILVCDALDPNMTFVVPLASGIVERRGGMLIHGAIIAREYGLPCVTGVPNVTSLIHTGDAVTVDGFLGIVIIG